MFSLIIVIHQNSETFGTDEPIFPTNSAKELTMQNLQMNTKLRIRQYKSHVLRS